MFKFIVHFIGFINMILGGATSFASVQSTDGIPASEETKSSSQWETLEVDVRTQKELDYLFDLIKALDIKAEFDSQEGSIIKIRMPKSDKLKLAGQIWRGQP